MYSTKISIITRTRNRPQLLQRAVQSVLGQENPPPWEWIIVNDAGNRAEVQAVLEEAILGHPNQINLIHISESKGMEHASNRGINQASGEYLVIHDDDDSWEPGFLRRMTDWLDGPDQATYAGVVCHSTRIVEEIRAGTIVETLRHPFNDGLKELSFWRVLQENPFPPISFVFRRSTYEAVGQFDESLPVLGDWEFNLRVMARSPISILPEALACYHHRPPVLDSAYANSITAGHNRHREVETRLRNSWMEKNPFDIPTEVFSVAGHIAPRFFQMKQRLQRLHGKITQIPEPPGPQF